MDVRCRDTEERARKPNPATDLADGGDSVRVAVGITRVVKAVPVDVAVEAVGHPVAVHVAIAPVRRAVAVDVPVTAIG
jgi:hypothetical protein